MSGLSEREKAIRQRLKDDFEHYAARCLKIRPKHLEGEAQPGLIPFRLNAVQQQLHARIEDQRARAGRVRILVLKARQPGVSTYVAGRYFWKVTHHRGIRVFILTHSDKATANLFAMAETYYEHCPGLIRPQIKASNAKELSFSRLNRAATARERRRRWASAAQTRSSYSTAPRSPSGPTRTSTWPGSCRPCRSLAFGPSISPESGARNRSGNQAPERAVSKRRRPSGRVATKNARPRTAMARTYLIIKTS